MGNVQGAPSPPSCTEACGGPAWFTARTHSHRALAGSCLPAAFYAPEHLSGHIRAAQAQGHLASCAAAHFLTIRWVLSVLCSLPSCSWEVEPVVPVIRELKLRAAIGGQNTNLLGSLSLGKAALGPRLTCGFWSPAQGGRCGDVVGGRGGRGDPSPWELRPHLSCLPQVASKAGVYEILNQLGFPELESVQDQPFSGLRCRWQERSHGLEPAAAGDFL